MTDNEKCIRELATEIFRESNITEDSIKNIDIVINSLPEKEEKIIRLRYGFDNGKKMTLAEIGKEVDEPIESVRFFLSRAIRKLRRHHKGELILLRERNKDKEVVVTPKSNLEDAYLSISSYLCLKRAGINTLEDLLNMRIVDLLRVKRIKKESIKEIMDFIANNCSQLTEN